MGSIRVEFIVYRNGVRVCESARVFSGAITESAAKSEIARTFRVSTAEVTIKSMQNRYNWRQ